MPASTNTTTFQAPPTASAPTQKIIATPINLDNTEICYIVAGNYNEFSEYILKKYFDKFYCYVDSPDKLRGVRNPKGFFIGSWRNRKDIAEIQLMIDASKW